MTDLKQKNTLQILSKCLNGEIENIKSVSDLFSVNQMIAAYKIAKKFIINAAKSEVSGGSALKIGRREV